MVRTLLAAPMLLAVASPCFAQVPYVNVIGGTTCSDSVNSTNGYLQTMVWNSTCTTGKTESLFSCLSNPGYEITVKIGNSSTFPIQIVPAPTNTIDGLASYALNANHGSVTLQCDGTGNWMLE